MTVRRVGVALLLFAGAIGLAAPAQARAAEVVRLDLDGVVQPLTADYVSDGISRAQRDGAQAVLLRIDTPGGLDRSMRRIVGSILRSRVPVVCWVGPSGARAASAGTFILLACDVATMAPGTNLGAAHPVGIRGEVLSDKITNDSAAFIRSIAEERGRNAEWAERSVRDSESASARQALQLDVIDALAGSPSGALRAADGKAVRGQAIDSWPAEVERDSIPAGRDLVGSLVDPNLAFLLFMLGLAGIVFEVLHPGLSFPGVAGLLSLVVALVMFEMLPVNLAGLLLLLAGIAFFILEVHIPGFGLPAAAGVGSLVVGGLLLFDAESLVRVSRAVIAGTVLGVSLVFLVVLRGALRVRRMAPPVPHSLVGAEGVAETDLAPGGTVRVRSESWTAEAASGETIPAGRTVVVIEEDGLRLKVM